jgi:hypothetical protein
MAQQEEAFKKFRADRDDERRGLEETVEQLRSQVGFFAWMRVILVPGWYGEDFRYVYREWTRRGRAESEFHSGWFADAQVAVLRANNQKTSQEAHASDVGFNPEVRQVWGLGPVAWVENFGHESLLCVALRIFSVGKV